MKALISTLPGGPETLEFMTVADPVAGVGEVVIRIAACGINFPDTLIIEDRYQIRPQRPFAPGNEIAGTVDSVGPGVTNLKPGDRVMTFCGHGGLAEMIAAKAATCVPIPATMPVDIAASFVLTYGTSLYALKNRARLKPGEKLLVLGASGGVGLAAVELGKAMGATVIAAVSSEDKRALALQHGADSCMIYPPGPFDADGRKALSALFKEACGTSGADVIYDPVGGDYAEASLRSIGWEGRFLVVGFPAGLPKIPLNLTLLKSCQIIGVFWGAATQRDWPGHLENLDQLFGYYTTGQIRPHISRRFAFAEARDALTLIAARKAMGKFVVVMDA
jgi:NADPH:quinone reductase